MGGLFTKDIVVLDVTSRLISAIVGVKKAQSVFGIKSVAEKEHPGYENGQWFDLDDTVNTVKATLSEAMRAADSGSKRLFIGVPAEFCSAVSKDVSINLDRRRRVVDDDVDFLLEKGNDFDKNEYVCANTSAVYFAINGEEKLYTDVRGMYAESVEACVSYMLAEKRFVDIFDKVAADLGFKDVKYIVSNWAECVSLLDSEQRESLYALIDVGYLSSSVTLAKGEGVLDMRSFSLGGGHICADIFNALDVPFELAQEAKRLIDINLNYAEDAILIGNGEKSVYAIDASDIVKARLDIFADIISGIFKNFSEDMPPYLPVYLTGEGIASMRGAKKYLSEQLGKNIEILTPKLPGFVKPEDSSKTALLMVAETLSKSSFGDVIKSIFSGGKK